MIIACYEDSFMMIDCIVLSGEYLSRFDSDSNIILSAVHGLGFE